MFSRIIHAVFVIALIAAQTATARTIPTVIAQGEHEYAPLKEESIKYRDWTFKSLETGDAVNLRRWAAGKKLVMVVYFTSWCKNWRYEAPVVAALYEKYKPMGLDVIAVSEYAARDEARRFFGDAGAPYTVVVESESADARTETTHYSYRRACKDTRRWGSPFYVFLEPASMKTKGDIVADKVWVVNGELIEREVETFIRKRLGLIESINAESGVGIERRPYRPPPGILISPARVFKKESLDVIPPHHAETDTHS